MFTHLFGIAMPWERKRIKREAEAAAWEKVEAELVRRREIARLRSGKSDALKMQSAARLQRAQEESNNICQAQAHEHTSLTAQAAVRRQRAFEEADTRRRHNALVEPGYSGQIAPPAVVSPDQLAAAAQVINDIVRSAAPQEAYTGSGGTFDGAGASGDWDRSPSSSEPSYSSDSCSSSSSDSSGSSGGDSGGGCGGGD